jgi:4-amino-4-deoxy-L-arabinose transferase-like glycosyltransferase
VNARGARRLGLAALLGLALGVRLALFAAASARDPAAFMAPDSYGYERLAHALLHQGRFADETGAHTRRTPLYPLLLAAVYAVAGEDPRVAVGLGIGLSVLTVWLTARVAERLWGAGAGLVAGLLLAVDVASITAARLLLTETVFTAVLVGAVAVAVSMVQRSDRPMWPPFVFGTLLALAALTRPIGLLLLVPAALWLALLGSQGGSWRARAGAIALLAAPWVVLVGGWQLRNRAAAGTFAPSDGPAKFLLLSRGSDVLAQRDGISPGEARERLAGAIAAEAGRTGVATDRLYLPAALDLIGRHPFLFAATQARWLPELLLGTGAAGLTVPLGLDPTSDPSRRAARWALSGLAALCLGAVYVGAALALAGIRSEAPAPRQVLVLLAFLVAYFVVLSTAPTAYSRFRVPVMPLLAIAAGRGWQRRGPGAAAIPEPST